MQELDIEKAKSYSTESTAAFLDMMKPMLEMGKASGEMPEPTEFTMGECTIDGEKATCKYTEAGEENELHLVLVEGEWKVDMNKEDMNKEDPGAMMEEGLDETMEGLENTMEGLDSTMNTTEEIPAETIEETPAENKPRKN